MNNNPIYTPENLATDLTLAIKQEFAVDQAVLLVSPKELDKGDLTTTVALSLSGVFKKTKGKESLPIIIAARLVKRLESIWLATNDCSISSKSLIDRVEIVAPGFINFWFANTYLHQINMRYTGGIIDNSQSENILGAKKVIVEFTDPNPFKEFHIGHLYSNIVGEAISRLKEGSGALVKRACYQGDVGMHVAKSIWGMQQKIASEFAGQALVSSMRELGNWPLPKRVKFLGAAYALGASEYENSTQAKTEIIEINRQIYQLAEASISGGSAPSAPSTSDLSILYKSGREWSLEYFDSIYSRLGMKFDLYFFESQVGPTGLKIVNEFLAKGVFEKSQGAIIFPGKKYGLHDRVFINSLGLPTYEAKELGLAPAKYEKYSYDSSIIITGNEIDEYFKVLLKAMSLTYPDLANKTTHLSHGMVRLPDGKMSSRTGRVITGEWLIDHATSLMEKRLLDSRPDMEAAKRLKIANEIALGAIKYALLKSNIGSDVVFSFDESLSFSGNSGPYIQYSALRCWGVLKKAAKDLQLGSTDLLFDILSNNNVKIDNAYTSIDKVVLRYFAKYNDVQNMAENQNAPHHLATYLCGLAQQLNAWYDGEKILEIKSGELTEHSVAKLLIAKSGFTLISRGLNLLGINIPEEM